MIFGCDFEFPEDKTRWGKGIFRIFFGGGMLFYCLSTITAIIANGADMGVDLLLWRIRGQVFLSNTLIKSDDVR